MLYYIRGLDFTSPPPYALDISLSLKYCSSLVVFRLYKLNNTESVCFAILETTQQCAQAFVQSSNFWVKKPLLMISLKWLQLISDQHVTCACYYFFLEEYKSTSNTVQWM